MKSVKNRKLTVVSLALALLLITGTVIAIKSQFWLSGQEKACKRSYAEPKDGGPLDELTVDDYYCFSGNKP